MCCKRFPRSHMNQSIASNKLQNEEVVAGISLQNLRTMPVISQNKPIPCTKYRIRLSSPHYIESICNALVTIFRSNHLFIFALDESGLGSACCLVRHCLTLVRLLTLPKTLFVNWCGSTKIFRSHLKMCSSSKDSLSILTKSCVR